MVSQWWERSVEDREAHTFDVRFIGSQGGRVEKAAESVRSFRQKQARNCFLILSPSFPLQLGRLLVSRNIENGGEIMRSAHGVYCNRERAGTGIFFDASLPLAWKDQRADFYLDVLRLRSRDERDAFRHPFSANRS